MEDLLLEYEGTFGHGRSLDSIVGMVDSLPPLPEVARRTLRLLEDPDSTPCEIAAVLRLDPALALVTLRAANSAAFGCSETISDLPQAIMVVGLAALRSKILAVTLKKWNRSNAAIEKLVWEKSLGTAAAAQAIATHLGKSYQTEAHLCGLLHNLGQIVMLSHPEVLREYPAVLRYICEQNVDYAEAERQVIGFSHPLIGGLVARRWKLPVSTCLCILRHNDPLESIETKQDEQIAITKLAASTSMCAGLGCPLGHPLFCENLQNLAYSLGFARDSIEIDKEVMIRQTRALYATEAAALIH